MTTSHSRPPIYLSTRHCAWHPTRSLRENCARKYGVKRRIRYCIRSMPTDAKQRNIRRKVRSPAQRDVQYDDNYDGTAQTSRLTQPAKGFDGASKTTTQSPISSAAIVALSYTPIRMASDARTLRFITNTKLPAQETTSRDACQNEGITTHDGVRRKHALALNK